MLELVIPPDAQTDPHAVELARIWVANQQQHVSLRTSQWNANPDIWGMMLCDLARHLANAYEADGVGTHEEILNAIVSRFLDELGYPTDEPTGGFISQH